MAARKNTESDDEFFLELRLSTFHMDCGLSHSIPSMDKKLDALPDGSFNKEELSRFRERLVQAFKRGNREAAEGWLNAYSVGMKSASFLIPHAVKGEKFTPGGRGPSPIRKRIEKVLAKDPSIKPRQVWDKIKSKPPAGWEFFDNSAGRYIEGPKGGQGMGYARFSEVCKEVRDKLKS